MEIRKIAANRISPSPFNPRTDLQPGDPEYDSLERCIREFGIVSPIVWNKRTGHIVGGHQRYKILRAQGVREVDAVVVDLTLAREKILNLALNRISGGWDERKLAELLDELVETPNFDVGLTGFDTGEVADLLASLIPTAPQDEEEAFDLEAALAQTADPVTKPGDLIQLGRHTLLCGDSADPEAVRRLVGKNPIHLLNMDPPYNVALSPRSNNAIATAGRARKHHQGLDLARDPSKRRPTTRKLRAKDRPLVNDYLSETEFESLLRKWFGNAAAVLLPGRTFYIWGGYANCANYPAALKEAGLYFSQSIIWVKEHPVLTRKDFLGNHEWAFYGWRLGAPHVAPGVRNATDVWTVPKVSPRSMVHLTEKPVELAVRAMMYSSKKGENVLDLFGGSGSTLIAAEKVGRRAFLMEIDRSYCDVIVRRFIAYRRSEVSAEIVRKYAEKETTHE